MLHTLISGDDSRTDHPCKEWIMASVTRTAWRPFWPRLACCLVVGMGCCVPPLYLESAGQGHHGLHGTDRFFTSPDVRLLHVKVGRCLPPKSTGWCPCSLALPPFPTRLERGRGQLACQCISFRACDWTVLPLCVQVTAGAKAELGRWRRRGREADKRRRCSCLGTR
jgi:hypothetical protein